MQYLEIVLYPIILGMTGILELGFKLFSSYGPAIIFLSLIVTILTLPLSNIASRVQKKENDFQSVIEPRMKAIKAQYRGEERFNKTEELYNELNYHPIKSIRAVSGLIIQFPFLLAALLLLWSYPPLVGTPFLFIPDLSQPDALLPLPAAFPFLDHINLLPIVMTALSLAEVVFGTEMPDSARMRVYIVSAVLFLLVYNLPSAVVLYWTFNNLWTLLRSAAKRRKMTA